MIKTRTNNSLSGTLLVCAHRVGYDFWDFNHELNSVEEEYIEDAAERHIKECISEGYVTGELCHSIVFADGTEEEIRGWWEIDRD